MNWTASAMSAGWRQGSAAVMAAARPGSPGYIADWNSVSTNPGDTAATRMSVPESLTWGEHVYEFMFDLSQNKACFGFMLAGRKVTQLGSLYKP